VPGFNPLPLVFVAHCRAGFEPEAAADLRHLAATAGETAAIDAPVGRGFVVGALRTFDSNHWPRAFERSPLVFVRSLFVGTGPHSLIERAATKGRADRIAPLCTLLERFCAEFPVSAVSRGGQGATPYASLRLETADTNDGKKLSGLTRSLAARLANALTERGVLRATEDRSPAPTANLHVLFPDGAHAYVGASVAPWASPWTMGIPRLRMPGSAPSRSTLKLAEAFVTFLGDRESDVLRAGMRAVDLGAAPGGWTWQLAHRGVRVVAVDNGPLKGVVRDDPLVTHLREDGLWYLPKRPVDWLVCDIVERPSRIATLVARWIGEGAQAPLEGKPAIDSVRLDTGFLDQELGHHPQIAVLSRQIDVAATDARIAQANKKADWSIELSYSQRGSAYSNMVSIGVSVPLQWDQHRRQDRELGSRLALVEQIKAQRDDLLRAHVAEVRAMVREWQNDRERLARYQAEIVPLAGERTRATQAAFRGGKASLTELLLARRGEIDLRLQALQLEMETARLWAQLNFLFPDAVDSNHAGASSTTVQTGESR